MECPELGTKMRFTTHKTYFNGTNYLLNDLRPGDNRGKNTFCSFYSLNLRFNFIFEHAPMFSATNRVINSSEVEYSLF